VLCDRTPEIEATAKSARNSNEFSEPFTPLGSTPIRFFVIERMSEAEYRLLADSSMRQGEKCSFYGIYVTVGQFGKPARKE
jgi:hypothetical protein